MSIFRYRARDAKGRLIQGRIEADGADQAAGRLQRDGLYPMDIQELRGHFKTRFHLNRTMDLFIFTRSLANLLKSNVPLVHGLDLLGKGAQEREFQGVLTDIKKEIGDGKSLSEALSCHPQYFSRLYVGMVRAGEMGGALEGVLYRLSAWLEREEKIRSEVYSAMIYPAIMLLVGGGAVLFLMGFVIPKFELMFTDIGSALPLPTRVLIGLCSILTKGWWVILTILLGGIFILGQYTRSENGRFYFSRILLGIPFIGQVRRRFSAARFSKALQILINSGVPLLDGLGITRDMEGNEVLKREVERLYHLVKSGEGLAASMSGSPFFSPLEIDMVRVGENSGDLAGALCRIAEIYEEEVDRSLKRLVSLLEPAIILFMGGVVGFIVLAMLLPVFRMGTLIR